MAVLSFRDLGAAKGSASSATLGYEKSERAFLHVTRFLDLDPLKAPHAKVQLTTSATLAETR